MLVTTLFKKINMIEILWKFDFVILYNKHTRKSNYKFKQLCKLLAGLLLGAWCFLLDFLSGCRPDISWPSTHPNTISCCRKTTKEGEEQKGEERSQERTVTHQSMYCIYSFNFWSFLNNQNSTNFIDLYKLFKVT